MALIAGVSAIYYIIGTIIGLAICALVIYYLYLKIKLMKAATKAIKKYTERRY